MIDLSSPASLGINSMFDPERSPCFPPVIHHLVSVANLELITSSLPIKPTHAMESPQTIPRLVYNPFTKESNFQKFRESLSVHGRHRHTHQNPSSDPQLIQLAADVPKDVEFI
jgi:hypothetical protein